MNLMDKDLIGCIVRKNKAHVDVYRDNWGKFYIRINGVITQKKLNASEVVRYLMNMLDGK